MRIRLYQPVVLLLLYVLLNSLSLSAQPLIQRSQDPDLYTPDRFVYKPGNNFHPSVRPYLKSETDLLQSEDSLITSLSYASRWKSKVGDWIWRKIFNEDLLVVDIPDFHLAVNPLLRMEVGQDFEESNHFYTNTRGFMADGHIGKQFAFATRFYENQAQFPLYINSEIRRTGVIPGQGAYKNFKGDGFDFSRSEGYISYTPSRYFNFQFGHGRNFFGDGYRSLLLGDAHFPYPYLKIETKIWRIHYTNLYAEFMDREAEHSSNLGYHKKYGTLHYLTMNVTNRLRVGLFEAIIWQAKDSTGYRGFDFNYLNPVIFYRPTEFSLGSPDNALLGFNASYTLWKNTTLYMQILLDEFKLKEVTSGDDWWANKYGIQFGVKSFDVFKVKGLDLQGELNRVRPYTYSHWDPIQNYGHYSQPLAHPLGANFTEFVGFVRYHVGRLHLSYQLQLATYGADTSNYNFGGNIFKGYNDNRPYDYGVTVGQGLKTQLMRHEVRVAWMVNPAYNLTINIGGYYRHQTNDTGTRNTSVVYLGLTTSLERLYYDF